jgi:hypothetical protein
MNAAVDFLEEEDKKRDLLSSWNNFKIEVNRDMSIVQPPLPDSPSNGNNFQISFQSVKILAGQK